MTDDKIHPITITPNNNHYIHTYLFEILHIDPGPAPVSCALLPGSHAQLGGGPVGGGVF